MIPEDQKKAYDEWVEKCLKEFGWYAHYVFDDFEQSLTGVNHHTHGLPDKYGFLDLQIVAELDHHVSSNIFWGIVESHKSGELHSIEADKEYSGVIKGFNVMFALAVESGRHVWRVIIPDPEGRLKCDEIAPPYDLQWKGTWDRAPDPDFRRQ